MRLHILSDLHLEHSTFEVPEVESDVLILAGDILAPGHRAHIWAARPTVNRGRPVVQVAGNHEFYGQRLQAERALIKETARRVGINFLDRRSIIIAGVRFLGCTLWTDYQVPISDGRGMPVDPAQGMAACAMALADHRAILWQEAEAASLLTPQNLLGEHLLDRQWLMEQLAMPFAGPTVVVTHHAPHVLSMAPQYANNWVSCGFVNLLLESFFEVPVLWVHGHTHTRFDYQIGTCRVVCNPRGCRFSDGRFEVADFDPRLVVEV